MKSLRINYDLFSRLPVKITLISDLHDYPWNKNSSFLDELKSEETDVFILDGDLIQGTKYKEGQPLKELKYAVDSLSESAPVFLKKGNHDLIGYTSESEKWFKSLEEGRSGRVFAAHNESVIIPTNGDTNLQIVDFTPSRAAFAPSGQDSGLAIKQAANDFLATDLPRELSTDKNTIKVVTLHNPKFWTTGMSLSKLEQLGVLTDETFEFAQWLYQFDMATAGHLHNGYILQELIKKNPGKYLDYGYWEMFLELDSKGNVKFVRPWVYKKTDSCRGAIYVGDGNEKVIQVSDGSFYHVVDNNPAEILNNEAALKIINEKGLKPVFISGGVNKFFSLPIDEPEITTITSKSHTR